MSTICDILIRSHLKFLITLIRDDFFSYFPNKVSIKNFFNTKKTIGYLPVVAYMNSILQFKKIMSEKVWAFSLIYFFSERIIQWWNINRFCQINISTLHSTMIIKIILNILKIVFYHWRKEIIWLIVLCHLGCIIINELNSENIFSLYNIYFGSNRSKNTWNINEI